MEVLLVQVLEYLMYEESLREWVLLNLKRRRSKGEVSVLSVTIRQLGVEKAVADFSVSNSLYYFHFE